jgi:hypothetical protein
VGCDRPFRCGHLWRTVYVNIWTVAALVALLNLPFGYWRAGVDKFSRQWFLAVHLPVPFVIALRIMSGLGFHLATLPVMIGAYFVGQYLGGMLNQWAKNHAKSPVTACLVMDAVTGIKSVIPR